MKRIFRDSGIRINQYSSMNNIKQTSIKNVSGWNDLYLNRLGNDNIEQSRMTVNSEKNFVELRF